MMLTEAEVAKFLRCSTSKIKRLRLDGELPYLAGRPILIDESDLLAFIEARKVRPTQAPERPPAAKEVTDAEKEAREWALQQIIVKAPRRRKGQR